MATCGADRRAGTHVKAAGLGVKEGDEKQYYEGKVQTKDKGLGPLGCCTGYERLVQPDATAVCEDDNGRGGSQGAPHPALCPGVQLHVSQRRRGCEARGPGTGTKAAWRDEGVVAVVVRRPSLADKTSCEVGHGCTRRSCPCRT